MQDTEKNPATDPQESGQGPAEQTPLPRKESGGSAAESAPAPAEGDAPGSAGGEARAARPRWIAFLDNFWYHHKFGTLVTAFLAVVLIICGVQMCNRTSYDVHVLYAGPWFDCATSSRVSALEDAFAQCMEDYNGDGKKVVAYRPIWIMSDAQLQALREEYAGREEEMPYINSTLLAQNAELLNAELMTGEAVICLLDPSIFTDLWESGWTCPLTEYVDASALPENPFDNHGIYLKDTAFGQYFTGLNQMPEDTVLCVRNTSILTGIWSGEEAAQAHAWAEDVFRRILAFRRPDAG